jgi:diacylglycerol O-acyltransferase
VAELKAASKKCGASFNDFMMAMISVALYRFFEQRGKTERRVRISIPVSFRKNAKSAEDLDLMNDIAPLFIDLNLNPDFETSLAQVRASTQSIRRSFTPYATYYTVKILAKIPMLLYLWVSNYTTTKVTIVFSNVAGPKIPLVYDGFTCKKIGFLLPALGEISCGLSLISMADKLKVGMLTDKNVLNDPAEIVNLLDGVRREVIDKFKDHIE